MHKICFSVSLFHASTCFEHHMLVVRRSKLYYTASGIITPIGGLKDISASQERLCHLLSKNYKSACAIC